MKEMTVFFADRYKTALVTLADQLFPTRNYRWANCTPVVDNLPPAVTDALVNLRDACGVLQKEIERVAKVMQSHGMVICVPRVKVYSKTLQRPEYDQKIWQRFHVDRMDRVNAIVTSVEVELLTAPSDKAARKIYNAAVEKLQAIHAETFDPKQWQDRASSMKSDWRSESSDEL